VIQNIWVQDSDPTNSQQYSQEADPSEILNQPQAWCFVLALASVDGIHSQLRRLRPPAPTAPYAGTVPAV
jgi:hypothetical protein